MISASDRITHKLLMGSGKVSAEVLDRALKLSEKGKQSFWRHLVDLSGAGETALYEILSNETGTPLVPLKKIAIDSKALQKVPVKIAWYYKFFPYKIEDGKVWVAVSQVPDVSMLDEIRFGIGIDAMIAFAPEGEIEEMLNKHYGLGADMVSKIMTQSPEPSASQMPSSTHQVEDLENLADTASIAQLVNQIILESHKKRASDIHFEPYRGKIRLRYRIDGVLQEAPVPAEMRKFFGPMISRIKIMANLNVVEKRLPQDGKMRVKTQDESLDLRVSCIPTAHGESLVIRILPGKNVWSLDKLGLDAECLLKIKKLLEKPNGILFVTGPTGSGKSTTLYACLTELNSIDRKIITVEDPVEYELEGISQIQVASDIGLTFSQGLRSILRHDPDALMVGEVRDLETADISIRAALTGHLILSTLHTNDAASGVTRLSDIGVEKYLIASSVIAFIAQRLVRVICPQCKEPVLNLDQTTADQMRTSLGLDAGEMLKVFRGRGCDACNGTGYSGRQAIHEILIVSDTIRKLIMDGVPAGELKKYAVREGMQTLRQSGFRRVLEGVTTPDEIIRVTPIDQEVDADLKADKALPNTASLVHGMSMGTKSQKVVPPEALLPGEYRPDPDQQRKFKRVEVNLPISFRIMESSSHHPQVAAIKDFLNRKDWSGEVENMSAGGLLFATENLSLPSERQGVGQTEIAVGDAIDSGTVLELQIHLPDGEKPVFCMARVLRVQRKLEPTPSDNRFVFHIAVLFLVINSIDRSRIEHFVNQTKV